MSVLDAILRLFGTFSLLLIVGDRPVAHVCFAFAAVCDASGTQRVISQVIDC